MASIVSTFTGLLDLYPNGDLKRSQKKFRPLCLTHSLPLILLSLFDILMYAQHFHFILHHVLRTGIHFSTGTFLKQKNYCHFFLCMHWLNRMLIDSLIDINIFTPLDSIHPHLMIKSSLRQHSTKTHLIHCTSPQFILYSHSIVAGGLELMS